MFTQNELDFDDHPICNEFPGASSKSGSDSPADKRLALVSDERDAARFDAHCLRQEKEQLRLENERLRLRAVRNQIFQDLNVLADAIQRETDS